MDTRELVLRLTHRSDLWIQAVMVFPKATVQAKFGMTREVDCVTEEGLCSYIQDEEFAHKLTKAEIGHIVQMFQSIASMERDFATEAGRAWMSPSRALESV
jgi:hypothetical protein